jgi:hypothetical protein
MVSSVNLGRNGFIKSAPQSTDGRKEVYSPRGYSLLSLSSQLADGPTADEKFADRLRRLGLKDVEQLRRVTDLARNGATVVQVFMS